MELSADYPGHLIRLIEQDEALDFAVYGAGAVGSMAPLSPPLEDLEEVKYIAENLASQVLLMQHATPVEYISELSYGRVQVELRESHWRISENIRLRPWVFKQVFGEVDATINVLKVGPQMFVGTPCDFSGELVEPLDLKYRDQGAYLLIHSFNGSYIGYITKDEWYDRDKYETRMMNWFGPYNGAYFSELIDRLTAKFL